MGNMCSSSQSNADQDSASNQSESPPCLRGRHKAKKKASNSSSSQHNVNDVKQERNGKVDVVEKEAGSSGNGSQSLNKRNADVREESSMASVDSQLDGATDVSSPPTWSAQLHQQPAGSSASRNSQTATVSAASVAAVPPAPTQPAVDPLSCLPETVRQCLNGCIPCVRTPERGVNLALYITPADSNAGGLSDVLRAAISQVQQLCDSRGASLQVFDLCQEAGRQSDAEERVARIFLPTLTRLMETTHLIPILIFNDTLGSTLLPRGIEAQDFQTALAATSDPADRTLVDTWYRLDQKTQPACYRLQSSASMDPSIQRRLLEIFISIFSPELSDAYLTTLFEQEVHNSVCMSQELARRCVWIQHGAACPAPPVADGCIIEQENRRRVNATQKALKSLLQEKHILRNGCEASLHLAATLQSIVQELLDDVEAKDVFRHVRCLPRCCLEEINQHIAFCQRAASCSVNREAALMAIKRYLTGSERQPFVIYGREGSGKTCLLARAAQNCQSWQPDRDTSVVLRFAGLTPNSHSVHSLLHSVTEQCSLLVTGRLPHVPHTLDEYKSVLYGLFDGQSSDRNIVIILDGVDELEDFESCADLLCSWVPRQLPGNVKLLLTLRDPQLLQSKTANSAALHQLDELSPSEARNLFNACLLQHAHSSHVDQVVSIDSKLEQCHLPVSVKIFSWQAGLADSIRQEDASTLDASVDIAASLSTAIRDIIDQDQAGKMISFLTSSRYGLCDYEMEQLCQLHMPSAGKNLWPKLAHFLAPFLCRVVVGGLSLVSWRDVTVRQQMMARYLADDEARQAVHQQMLDYYWQVWRQWRATLTQSDQTAKMAAVFSHSWPSTTLRLVRRALDEIPHHLCKARQSPNTADQWLQLMTDFSWLLAKLATSGVVQVIEDLNLALRHHPSDQLQAIRKMLVLSAPALNYDYRQLYGQLEGRTRSGSGATLAGLQTWLEQCRNPLIPCLVPTQQCLNGHLSVKGGEGEQDPATCEQVFFSAIHRLVGEPDQAAALSTVRDEMSLWDFRSGSCDKVLYNLHQPSKVAPMPNHRCVVLCGRELRVYDISSGEELLKLKGIMNQKLPLFGLHGDSHVVSLSRNRMYVNLISLENGDCVTTFKVGEDRFLNSLLVSDNGRILVCGDESKRPCSLLVWDLQAKKLIYDLKMNHHEFITRLSAITGEGTYVSCVCKELETNDPNFIVVYDLQSGTLFKKWKAGANTVAVTIACQNTCVVTSLEDARILVWDLVTGNCRWTLLGHTSAVDMLNLDLEGSFLLSWDSDDNDRSLRLWNLSNGQDVATFTPDQRTTAAQLSADGQTVLVALAGRSDLLQLNLTQSDCSES